MACSISAIKSSTLSKPIENLTVLSLIPIAANSSFEKDA